MYKHYETLIVGGGISGAALAYELARYTDIQSICVLEKYEKIGALNTGMVTKIHTLFFIILSNHFLL